MTAGGGRVAVDGTWHPPRRSVAAWALYDLANTIFTLGVGSLYFAEWLTDRPGGDPDLHLALTRDGAMLAVIVLAPWIGARSDHRGRRVPYLAAGTFLAVIPTFFLVSFSVTAALALFAAALVGFNLATTIYDALLPDVSTPQNRGRVSGLGVGLGYLGSFLAVGVGALFLDDHGHDFVFQVIAVLFLALALPAFFLIEERPRRPRPGPPPPLRQSLAGLVAAWRRARTVPGVTRFLVGRFFYTDAINTLIGGFLTIFVIEELDFSDAEVQGLLAVAIAAAMAGGLASGRLVDRFGPRALLHGAVHTWMVAMAFGIVAVVADSRPLAWVLGVIGGFSLGATWTADRVYMARLSPPEHLGEFYGLYNTVGRFSSLTGPLVWAFIVSVAGLPRTAAMGALIGFLVVARVVLAGVDDAPRAWDTAVPPSGA